MNCSAHTTRATALVLLGFLFLSFELNAQSPDAAQAPVQKPSQPDSTKKSAPVAHRVFTNDDIPSRTPGNSTPEIEARLRQLNFCDRACFAQVFKDSQMGFRQRYRYSYPFSSDDDHAFEDAILSRMDSLRRNAEWQNLLRNALIAQTGYCLRSAEDRQKALRERASGRPITSADIAAEEAASKDTRPIPNYNAATSAIIDYKFKIEKDFLLAAIVLYKYFEIVKPGCSAIADSE